MANTLISRWVNDLLIDIPILDTATISTLVWSFKKKFESLRGMKNNSLKKNATPSLVCPTLHDADAVLIRMIDEHGPHQSGLEVHVQIKASQRCQQL